jgi:tetratricopeptide (TPR) repeat protein
VELAAGDDSLRELAFERALAIYRPLAESAPSPLREAVCYRIGLCLEGLGRLEAALAEYRRIGPSTFAPRAAAAGQLGQARVYVRLRKPEEAKSLLYDLVLRSNQTGLREQPFLGDVAYLLGLASILQTTRPPRPGPLHDSVISHTGTDWPVERALGFLAGREEPAVEQTGGAYVLVERAGSTPEAFAVRASVRAMPVVECLERLAEQSGLGLDLSVQARRKLEGRVLLADVYSLPLAEVLRAVSEPLGLLTRCREVQLLVRAEEELSPEALETLRRGAARQTLQAAIRRRTRSDPLLTWKPPTWRRSPATSTKPLACTNGS